MSEHSPGTFLEIPEPIYLLFNVSVCGKWLVEIIGTFFIDLTHIILQSLV